MSPSPPFRAYAAMRTEEDPYITSTVLPLGLGLATLRPLKNIDYDRWFNGDVLRRQLDRCTDPQCPLLLNAMYLTVEARQAKARKREDERNAQLRALAAHNIAKEAELTRREMELNNKIRQRNQELRAKEKSLQEREESLRKRELNLKQQGRKADEIVSQGKQIDDVGAQQKDRPLHGIKKPLPNKHAKLVENGPSTFFPPPTVSPTTPSLPKDPPVLPPPTGSIPSSGPALSPRLQPEISTLDAANELSYSCINCSKPDNELMIACQNGKACLSRFWSKNLGGIHSANDAWFHISHFNMTEAQLYEFTQSKEDWYCPQCQKPKERTDPDEYTTPERSMTPERSLTPDYDKYTMIKLHGRQTKTHDPKKPTTTKRRRQAVIPDSKKSTNGEKSTKKSNRRKQRFWKDPRECQALIDSMRTVIETNDKTEQKYLTASALMLSRGFDRSRYQIKNKWNREIRKEAQRQGVPEDRHEKPGLKLVTGVQTPADRKRKREGKREQKRALEMGLFGDGSAKRMAETEEEDGEEDAEGEGCEQDAEGEDYEEYDDDDDDDDDDEDEEGRPKPKRQRFF
ncbi:hypothetical protein JMJ35_001801 [Cladonia borealis]|uniref:Uncharacterized protein n=1 Tax=Cladonia borealis TaxID=184061 RepID=A0AA39R6E4_9LECA|nr:hypothetical protein JMJ35_001801 [Cladonia borealis]